MPETASDRATIFVSHSNSDAGVADEIGKRLTALQLKPWIYRDENEPGAPLVSRINEGLSTASYFLLLASKQSMESKWVQWEMDAATYLRASENGLVLLPLLLETVRLPPLWLCLIKIDFVKDREKGLTALTEFFRRELEKKAIEVRKGETNPEFDSLSLRELRLTALNCLDDQDIETLLRWCESPVVEGMGVDPSPKMRLMHDLYQRPDEVRETIVDYLVEHRASEAEDYLAKLRQKDSLGNIRLV